VFELLGGRNSLHRGPGNDAGQRAGAIQTLVKPQVLTSYKYLPTAVRAGLRGALSHQRNNQKYGAATLSFSTFGRISPKIIHNLGTRPVNCSPILF
jgi:hypothetical protein